MHASKAEPNRGVVVYRSEEPDEKVRAQNEPKLDYGAVEEDYVSDAVLIGESLMRAPDPEAALRDLLGSSAL